MATRLPPTIGMRRTRVETPRRGAPWRSRATVLEHRCSFFVEQDRRFEFAEVSCLVGRNLNLAHYVFALVMQHVSLGRNRRVVAGEVHVDVHGIGRLVDHIAGRQRDIETVAPMPGMLISIGYFLALLSITSGTSRALLPTTRGRSNKSGPAACA